MKSCLKKISDILFFVTTFLFFGVLLLVNYLETQYTYLGWCVGVVLTINFFYCFFSGATDRADYDFIP